MVAAHSLFDILGPVMIGPSSSHTAGAARLGLLARAIAGGQPDRACIALHGSFASTGRGHGTDLAIVAGLLGIGPDNPEITQAFELAKQAGLEYSLSSDDLGEVHPNTARFELEREGRTIVVEGASIGGGQVRITRIDAYEVEVSGQLPLLLVAHTDQPGEIARVTALLAETGANIAAMHVSRAARGGNALMLIETDTPVDDATVAAIAELSAVSGVRRVPAV